MPLTLLCLEAAFSPQKGEVSGLWGNRHNSSRDPVLGSSSYLVLNPSRESKSIGPVENLRPYCGIACDFLHGARAESFFPGLRYASATRR